MKRYILLPALCLLSSALFLSAVDAALGQNDEAGDSKPAEAAKPEAAETAAKPEPAEPAKAEPATHTVKAEPLKIEVSLDGVFTAVESTEVVLRPKAWSSMKVLSAVEHGATVKKGQRLVTLDLEKLDEAIADLRTELETTDLALKVSEEELKALRKITPMDVKASERSKQFADEDYQRYFEVDRPMNVKSTEFSLEMAKNYLDYQREEVRQLEKMYEADDLTEETEAIVLKRARDALKAQEFSYERAKAQHEEAMKVALPRMDEQMEQAYNRLSISLAKSKLTLPVALKTAEISLQKSQIARARSQEKLDNMLADRELLLVKSPASGVVYYGKFSQGKYGGATSAADDLRQGGSISANEVFMTIVRPRPMVVRTTVPEKELSKIAAGTQGTAVPTAFDDQKLPVTVEQISAVPITAGNFDAELKANVTKRDTGLMPGMTCKVTLVAYENQQALTVPPSAVVDEQDGSKHFVYLVDKHGNTKKWRVAVGKRTDKKVEIIRGLNEGDKVLQEAPKE